MPAIDKSTSRKMNASLAAAEVKLACRSNCVLTGLAKYSADF